MVRTTLSELFRMATSRKHHPVPSCQQLRSVRLLWAAAFYARTLTGGYVIEEKDVFKPEAYQKQFLGLDPVNKASAT